MHFVVVVHSIRVFMLMPITVQATMIIAPTHYLAASREVVLCQRFTVLILSEQFSKRHRKQRRTGH